MYRSKGVPFSESPRYAGGPVAHIWRTPSIDGSGDHIRVGDADRDIIFGRLKRAVVDGRLTLTEYDTRLQQLYRAETRGELDEVVSDLPRSDARSEPKCQPRGVIPTWVVIMWTPWVAVNILCLAIWLITRGYFWPFWVELPWGCALMIPTAVGVLTGRCGGVRSDAVRSEERRRAALPPSRDVDGQPVKGVPRRRATIGAAIFAKGR